MRKIYHLANCSTCIRIFKGVNLKDIEMVNIKEEPILEKDLDFAAKKLGSYEALFSKRAMKYRSLGLHEKQLSEKDMKNWILKEYTFLKRPLVILEDEVFSGSAPKEVERLQKALS